MDKLRAQLPYTLREADFPALGQLYRGKVRDNFARGDRIVMITTDRPTPPNATHRRRSPLSGAEGPRPMARLPCQITHCDICVQTNHSPAALLYCNLTTHALPDGRAALTAPG